VDLEVTHIDWISGGGLKAAPFFLELRCAQPLLPTVSLIVLSR
jgi:hypothetical protein